MITQKQYLQRKIDATHFYPTDGFYLDMANELCTEWEEMKIFNELPEVVRQEVVLNIVGYMMDIAADLGLWRAFIDECHTLYGRPIPFFEDEVYVDYELNRSDVRWLTWYGICFAGDPGEMPLYPQDRRILALADKFYDILEKRYDDAPRPEGMLKTNDLEMHEAEDAEAIQTLGQWVFWTSYLCVPCFKTNMAMIYGKSNPDDRKSLLELMGQAQMELPTGPLALYLREWVWLIVAGKMPPAPRNAPKPAEHPYFRPFMQCNAHSRIAFFNDYKKLNQFLGKALDWDAEADNLPQLKNSHDFTLLCNENKGLLIGRDVARCICHPDNPFYDKDYARSNAFRMLSQRGFCPIDLTIFCLQNHLLPDLQWPGIADSNEFTLENADFIARCFLLQYYRAV